MWGLEGDWVLDGEVCIVDDNGKESFHGLMSEITRKNHTIANPKFKWFDIVTLADFEGLDVYLIKPNTDELRYMVDEENINEDNYRDYMKKIQEAGVRNILLSMGKNGALYYGEYGTYHVSTPKIKVVKSIGAGDSMLGTFVATILQTNDIEKSLRLASAASTSIVSCEGMPSAEMINEMTERIAVTRIK